MDRLEALNNLQEITIVLRFFNKSSNLDYIKRIILNSKNENETFLKDILHNNEDIKVKKEKLCKEILSNIINYKKSVNSFTYINKSEFFIIINLIKELYQNNFFNQTDYEENIVHQLEELYN